MPGGRGFHWLRGLMSMPVMEDVRRRALQREKLEQEAAAAVSDDSENTASRDENEELWSGDEPLAQVTIGGKQFDVRQKVLRRSTSEATLAFIVHLAFLIYCTSVNVADSTAFKRCRDPGRYFYGYDTFGGRWKYLTYLTMWGLLAYFFMAFFTDIMPQSPAKKWSHELTDWVFTTVVWPAAWIEVILYWVLVNIDLKLVDIHENKSGVFHCVSPLLDHAWHTFPVPIVMAETILVFHRYPSNMKAAFSIFAVFSGYFLWILVVFSKLKEWPYPFMEHFNHFTFILFMAGCTVFGGVLYVMGKVVSYFRWKERFQVLQEISNEDLAYEAEDDEY